MSELNTEGGEITSPVVCPPMQAGQLLREAREAQGLHVGALAVALKVPVKKLEALEACCYDQLPDMVFVRALALSVCRALRIDSSQVMANLPPLQASPFKGNDAKSNTRYAESTRGNNRTVMAYLTSPMGLGVLLLVMAMVVVMLWPVEQTIDSTGVALSSQKSGTALQGLPSETAAVSSLVIPSRPALASVVATDNTSAQVGNTLTPATQQTGLGLKQNTIRQDVSMEFTVRGATWVEVTDAAHLQIVRRLVEAGEVLHVSGHLPLSVVVGRADQVAVLVQGKPMDIVSLAKNNVARFEVK